MGCAKYQPFNGMSDPVQADDRLFDSLSVQLIENRLGDAAARERYGATSLVTPATSQDPPPLPPLPADFVEPPPFASVHRPGVS